MRQNATLPDMGLGSELLSPISGNVSVRASVFSGGKEKKLERQLLAEVNETYTKVLLLYSKQML